MQEEIYPDVLPFPSSQGNHCPYAKIQVGNQLSCIILDIHLHFDSLVANQMNAKDSKM